MSRGGKTESKSGILRPGWPATRSRIPWRARSPAQAEGGSSSSGSRSRSRPRIIRRYVYLIPTKRCSTPSERGRPKLGHGGAAAEEATAERDKLKTTLEKYTSSDKDKTAAEAKQKTSSDALELALKAGLGDLGATVTADGAKLRVSFPVGKVIDANGMDVSEAGQAAMKILAGAAKKEDAKVRVVARTSSAPPPKELRSLFHTAGEMRAVRAARVMSALEEAGPRRRRWGSWAKPTSQPRRRAAAAASPAAVAGPEGRRGGAAARPARSSGRTGVMTVKP